ncbi:DsbA family protein [Marinococcus halophilus]|uniref:Disulfide bond formation protein D n=1 Tax=Marinococcus halophilus TaxID=1371 RepID=A0A510Y9Q4_MARHA|nr:DsbA family protein [Marinococcus halophilus]GEK60078.1 disulfide bond formation protein D [Marinococcus halophilus]
MSKKPRPSSGRTFAAIVAVIAVILLAIILVGNFSGGSDNSGENSGENLETSGQPLKGEEDAPVTVVEFGDYKCPACQNFHESVVPEIEAQFVESGDAAFHYVHYPFLSEDSTTAAEFSEAVYGELGDEAFWNFHDTLFANQPQNESGNYFDQERLTELLRETASGEEVTTVVEAYENGTYEEEVENDRSMAEDLGVNSTPSVFVNGELFEGDSYQELLDMIAEEAGE